MIPDIHNLTLPNTIRFLKGTHWEFTLFSAFNDLSSYLPSNHRG